MPTHGLVAASIGIIVLLVTTVAADLVSEEVRGWLDALPRLILRRAARTIPAVARDSQLREWLGELEEYLHGQQSLPLTRLARGLAFAVGLWSNATEIKMALGYRKAWVDRVLKVLKVVGAVVAGLVGQAVLLLAGWSAHHDGILNAFLISILVSFSLAIIGWVVGVLRPQLPGKNSFFWCALGYPLIALASEGGVGGWRGWLVIFATTISIASALTRDFGSRRFLPYALGGHAVLPFTFGASCLSIGGPDPASWLLAVASAALFVTLGLDFTLKAREAFAFAHRYPVKRS